MNFFAEFFLTKYGYYCKEAHPQEMWIVAGLFTSDIGCPPDKFYIDWLDDPEVLGIDGNVTSVELMNNETIEICDLLDDESSQAFIMPKEQYRKMVLDWQDLCKHKPKEILITWDGKEISVEGRN